MPTLPVTLIKGDKVSSKTDYRDALPVNMYAVRKEILGANGYMIVYPGLAKMATGQGQDRAGNYNERFSEQYRVSGNSLISVSSGGVVDLGTIPGSSQAAMPYSFNTQCIIADGKMFLYDPSGGFREVTDSDLGNPIDGVWINGYYFLTDGESIYHTELSDGDNNAAGEHLIDGNTYATAEFMPDPPLGVGKTHDNKAIVFGRYTTEYFVDVESPDFAFTRIETRAQKIGIVATHAKCESGNKWYITGGRKENAVSVHVLGSGVSAKVSTREIDKILAEYSEPKLSDMRMECRTENDVVFILVHLPNETLCFNETVAESVGIELAWSILKTDVQGDAPYRGINGVFDARSSRWIYGDKRDDTIGFLDNSISTHYDRVVEWILFTPFLDLDGFSIDEIDMQTIPGHTSFNDATVAFSKTSDGITYSQEWWELYGAPMDYGQRFFLRAVGYVSDWTGFKFRGASKSRMAFALMKVTYS